MVGDVVLIIEKCNAGDGDAWKLFVKDFAPLAKNIITHHFEIKPLEQEDIIQNVFIKLIGGGFKHFRGTSHYEFLKYFKTIVINETKSHITSENKIKEKLRLNDGLGVNSQKDDLNAGCDDLTFIDTVKDEDKSSRPDCVAEKRDLLGKVSEIIRNYPLIDQEIFMMKVKGYKDEDVKTILKIPIGTVASKYSRMRTKIMEELGDNL